MAAAADFGGTVVLLGFGSIGQCLLPMLLRTFALPAARVTVLEAECHDAEIAPYREAGIHYRVAVMDRGNLEMTLASLLRPGDLLLNVSVGIDSFALADWCHQHGALYLDTSIEPWEDFAWDRRTPARDRTEYALHQRARAQAAARWRADGPTAVFNHGANPGLVSHFAKAALLDLATALGLELEPPCGRRDWAQLARASGTKVIHISERDTQITREPRRPGEFLNTWSIEGFVEEAVMPGEIGWGSHEKALPPLAARQPEGPGNAIYFDKPGGQILLRSWVPLGGQIAGLALPHSETITLSDYLTVEDQGRVAYRPTVAFVYLASDVAMASLAELVMDDWRPQPCQRVINEDVIEGRDELGVFLLGHRLNGWWYGSQLDIHEARRLVPGHNPTAVQVAAGALAGALWAVRNPACGYCEPERLPHDEVLATARPYLGPMVSRASDWTPLKHLPDLFAAPWLDREDPWQFTNFLVR